MNDVCFYVVDIWVFLSESKTANHFPTECLLGYFMRVTVYQKSYQKTGAEPILNFNLLSTSQSRINHNIYLNIYFLNS